MAENGGTVKGYKCGRCGLTFRIPNQVAEDDGFDYPPYRYTYVCPFCVSSDFDDYDDDDEEDNSWDGD